MQQLTIHMYQLINFNPVHNLQKKLVNVSDQTNPNSKKTRTDGTETSNSWQAENFEDSVVYKAKAKEMWKQAQHLQQSFKQYFDGNFE